MNTKPEIVEITSSTQWRPPDTTQLMNPDSREKREKARQEESQRNPNAPQFSKCRIDF